jgi:hypothetical protein
MSWTPRLKAEFRDALLDRYRSVMKLQIFLADAIGADLNRLTSNGNLEEVCYQAIEELDAQGELDALYLGFRAENPSKPFSQRSDLPPRDTPGTEDVPSERDTTTRSTMNNSSPSYDFSGANFTGPVNFGNDNKGDLIGTQNNYYGERPADVQAAIDDLRDFVTFCEQEHPQLASELEAQGVIEAEIIADPAPQPTRWQALRAQLRNPERHLQAFKATAVEVAKHEFEKNVVVKAVLTYVDKLSETPDQGA